VSGRRELNHERRVLLTALLAGLPGVLVALILLVSGPYSPKLRWTLALLVALPWLAFAFALRGVVARPLQTVSNLLAALREEDYSFRARVPKREDALGDVMREVNALAVALREQRLGALEATALLRKVMGEIEVAVFAFDGEQRLRLVNRAGERLLGRPAERLLGYGAVELGLGEALGAERPAILELAFPGAVGRFELRRTTFRQDGLPHQLVVLSDVSRALRQEERLAWQRLIRVLGHELHNSLAPIKSIAGSLASLLDREPRPPDWETDARRGLAVVASRAEALGRFTDAYARLARLPAPRREPVAAADLVRRVVGLETRLPIVLVPGSEVVLQGDADQLEQLLINLVRNGVDAALETGGGVFVGWTTASPFAEIWVDDEGLGLPESTNLFVPFFTTKPQGSGLGLAIVRKIVDAHDGRIDVRVLETGGTRFRVTLPVTGTHQLFG
jgi:nitrogen fixation/metabolism regulation signal transduction histidine kinase